MSSSYKPEEYWSGVGKLIESREEKNVIAGDDEPFYRYKRQRFLELLRSVNFKNRNVVELGCGPGGNLSELSKLQPAKLSGIDLSATMVGLATKNFGHLATIYKTDGKKLDFPDNFFEVAITATVLQHNTDDTMLRNVIKELCRVTSDEIYIFERIEKSNKGDELCMGRTVEYYSDIFKENGYTLGSKAFSNIQISYLVCGSIRKGLNSSKRKEGEPLNAISIFLQNITLPVTKILDRIFKADRDLCKLQFIKNK